MPAKTFFSKPTILFLSLNVLRVLSIVAICLVFAGELYTLVTDVRGFHSASSSSSSAASTSTSIPAATASTVVVKRAVVPVRLSSSSSIATATSAPAAVYAYHAHSQPQQTSAPIAFVGAEAHQRRRMARKVVKREHVSTDTSASSSSSASTASTSSKKKTTTTSTSTFSTALPTSSSSSSSTTSSSSVTDDSSCAYIGKTSIPRTTGGILFATLERVFCLILLLLSLLSELPLPPLLYTPLQSFWTYLFPPFGANFGVGVLGALQCFLGSNLLSKNVEEWVQVGGWILFLVGILNLLAGLAFGRRLNPIRSFSADSTSPSALRKLRLASSSGTSPSSPANSSASRLPPSSSYVQFDEPEMEEGPSFRPIKSAMKPPGKRSLSRNGANGIVISPPRPLRPISSHSEGEEQLTDVHREREREMARGKTVSPPPPVYFTAARE